MKTPLRNSAFRIPHSAFALLALALSFAAAQPAAADTGPNFIMMHPTAGATPHGDVFQVINDPVGFEHSIHGVQQMGALIVVNVTITGPSLVGATRIPVTISPALASAPLNVLTIFSKTTSSEDNVVAVTYDTATGSGFFVNLSGPAISGQVMHCLVFCP